MEESPDHVCPFPTWIFAQPTSSYAAQLNQQPGLLAKHKLLAKKIAVLALMEMVFAKPSDDRIVSFESIAKATELNLGEVELMVMHALSMGLIRGRIDQVSERVEITWVQPRILSLPQIEQMGKRLVAWGGKIKDARTIMEAHITPELIA